MANIELYSYNTNLTKVIGWFYEKEITNNVNHEIGKQFQATIVVNQGFLFFIHPSASYKIKYSTKDSKN